MSPSAIPMAKQVIRHLRADTMAGIARRVLRLSTVAEIERVLLASLGDAGQDDRGLSPDANP
jgi:phosphoenolpyruvate-protein kinase (PTS system EI component)